MDFFLKNRNITEVYSKGHAGCQGAFWELWFAIFSLRFMTQRGQWQNCSNTWMIWLGCNSPSKSDRELNATIFPQVSNLAWYFMTLWFQVVPAFQRLLAPGTISGVAEDPVAISYSYMWIIRNNEVLTISGANKTLISRDSRKNNVDKKTNITESTELVAT